MTNNSEVTRLSDGFSGFRPVVDSVWPITKRLNDHFDKHPQAHIRDTNTEEPLGARLWTTREAKQHFRFAPRIDGDEVLQIATDNLQGLSAPLAIGFDHFAERRTTHDIRYVVGVPDRDSRARLQDERYTTLKAIEEISNMRPIPWKATEIEIIFATFGTGVRQKKIDGVPSMLENVVPERLVLGGLFFQTPMAQQ